MFAYTKLMQAMAAAGVVSATDPYFNLTTLLLPGNGTNGAQNNTFLDSSSNNFTITRNGNTTQGTFTPFSQTGWGNFFDGSASYISAPNNSAFDFGSGNFTVEMWVYPTAAAPANGAYLYYKGTGGNFAPILIQQAASGYGINFLSSSAGTSWDLANTSFGTLTANAWNHIAICRSGSNAYCFLNGVLATTLTNWSTTAVKTDTNPLLIGYGNVANSSFSGYMSNLRVVKGTALYTSGFTPPTSPLTAITNTSLLTCQSNRFVDNSSNAFAITVNGTPSVQAFSPFAPTAAYSASTNGGSGYSDGTGDYLTVASNANLTLGSSDFTIELWWYPLAFNSDGEIFTMGSTGGTNRCYAMYSSGSNGTLAAFAGTGGTSWDIVSNLSMGTATQNAWNHMAFTRSGSTFSTYLNGSRIATTTASGTLGSSGLGIFANNSGTSQAPSGYIGGARTIKGTALYTGTTYTVPTAPFTAVTNTNLLLNFTNAGITDATAKNDLETVGNAQISTTQSKFGGSSMYFDGTGDTLSLPPSQNNLYINGGNFTLEFWYRFAVVPGTQYFYTVRQDGNNYLYIYATSTGWVFDTYSNSIQGPKITSSSITHDTTTWHHFALVYNNGTYNLYVDGTSVGSQANSSVLTTLNGFAVSLNYYIASRANIDSYVNGYIDDFRITRYARYTANFTPPTAAFPVQ